MLARSFLILSFFSAALSLGAETRRPLLPEDFAAIRDVDEPNLSPDGRSVVYVLGTVDLAKDKQPKNLWLAQWDGSENRALTFGEEQQTHPRWSPDGKWIAFLSSRTDERENDQLWILSSAGGEAEKLTTEKGSVDDFAWSPDSQRLVLVVHDPDPRDPEAKEKEKKTVPPIVIDRFQFKQDIAGYLTNRWSHLKLLDFATRKIESLTNGPHDNVLPAWSPDGKQIAFVSKRGDDADRTENWDLYLIEAKPSAKERQLTTTPEADSHPDWESAPAWSPDGKMIAYIHGGDPKKISYATHSLATIPAAGGEAKYLTASLDRNFIQPHWAPDGKSIFAVLEDDGAETLVRVPVAGGADPGSTESRPTAIAGGRRKVTAYDVSHDGKIIVRASTPDRPFEIFAAEDGELRCLTKQNDSFLAKVQLGRVEETKFKSPDGTEVHGFLVHPPNEKSGGKLPAILRPHGGPQSQYANEFEFEKQLFAAHGYLVILPNPRGSTGRGTDFAMGIFAAWGSVDVQDDLAAVDDAIARGLADPDRLGVGGWSYGGMATNYLIASTTRFKAAVSGASISNVLAGYGTDQYIRDYEYELGAPWAQPEVWEKLSYPFLHADRIKTPTLFLCGENDYNVPLLNSEQMYQALRTLGVPTQLVIYPGQFHTIKKPSYILDRYQRHLGWFGKWMPK
ncbi:MAG: S9 family peptidase [Verrucomicrobiota bacterium]|nr:S9 family peptidase [Verrucomicrobiota bacterium]